MNTIAQRQVLDLMKASSRYELYEAGDHTGKRGCGRYYLTYADGSPVLGKDDVEALLKGGVLKRKWPDLDGWFVLT